MDEKSIKEALLKGERVTLECKWAKSEKYTNDFKDEQIHDSTTATDA